MHVLIANPKATECQAIRKAINDVKEDVLVSCVHSLTELIEKQKSVDLVFIDSSWLDSQYLRKETSKVVTSCFKESAYYAYEHSAFDFLMMPLCDNKLKAILRRFENILKNQAAPSVGISSKIGLYDRKSMYFVDPNDIIYCKADTFCTQFFMENEEIITVSKYLKRFEEILPYYFVRVSRSYMVNVNKISRMVNSNGGYLIMNDGSSVSITAGKKDLILSMISTPNA